MLADKLTPFINRYNELSKLLSSPDITSDIKKMTLNDIQNWLNDNN